MNNVCVIFNVLPWRIGYPLPFLPWEYPLKPPTRVSPKPKHSMLIPWFTTGFE